MQTGQLITTKLNTQSISGRNAPARPTDKIARFDGKVVILQQRGRWCKSAFESTWEKAKEQ